MYNQSIQPIATLRLISSLDDWRSIGGLKDDQETQNR
jgi:hypothetical protein